MNIGVFPIDNSPTFMYAENSPPKLCEQFHRFHLFHRANNVEDTAGMSKHRLKRHITPTISNNTQPLYKYSPDVVPPIHAVSYHVATDKPPSQDGDKFRSILSDSLQPIATRGKKARGTLLVDQHCGNGCSIKRAPLSVSYNNEISGGHIGRGCSEEVFCRPSTAPVHTTNIL